MQFCLMICLYDGCLSYVMLAQGSLLADMAVSSAERARCNSYNSALSILGSCSVLFSHLFWDTQDMASFRSYVALLGLLGFAGFQCTVMGLGSCRSSRLTNSSESKKDSLVMVLNPDKPQVTHRPNWKEYAQQLKRQHNFWIFVAINFIQVANWYVSLFTLSLLVPLRILISFVFSILNWE